MTTDSTNTLMEKLQAQCVDAILQAAQEFRTENADLFGFSLCTDDGVSTLFHIACTKDWVLDHCVDDPDIAYISVEWTLYADKTQFRAVSRQLSALSEEDEDSPDAWEAARDRRFGMLVSALKECRDAGAFSPETLLSAGSTDPSEDLQAMAMNAVDELNKPEIADRFAKAHGYEKYRIK